MNLWQKILSSYFGFNKQQRNGLLVLVIVVVVLFGIRLSIHHFIKPEPILAADFSHINFEDQKYTAINNSDTLNENPNTLFAFDPNTASKEQFLKLGFKEKVANTLINYRNKGGHFYKKEDLKKVYGMKEEFYNLLQPYILIGKATETKGKEALKETETNLKPQTRNLPDGQAGKKQPIELNTADSLTLLKLRGIGPAYAKRIIKYRTLLGGFYNVNQLAEVYGIKDSLFQSLKKDVTVNPDLIKKINVNQEVFKELKHPYLSYEKVRAIFYWRKKNGLIQNTEQVKTIMADNAMYEKLKPYIDFL